MSAQDYCSTVPKTFHRRIQESFFAQSEKTILVWLATRTPAWINSDQLTLLGFVSQCLVGVCYALSRANPRMLIVGIVFLALNWLGDSMDGTLARVRNRQRPRYGFYVDHMADSIAAVFLMAGLSVSGYVHLAVSIGMLVAFLLLSIEAYLSTHTLGEFHLSYWRFGPTEIRVLLAIGNLALLKHSSIRLLHQRMLLFDLGGVISIFGMVLMLLVSIAKHTRTLYRQEQLL